jgi:hypothetical protein
MGPAGRRRLSFAVLPMKTLGRRPIRRLGDCVRNLAQAIDAINLARLAQGTAKCLRKAPRTLRAGDRHIGLAGGRVPVRLNPDRR